MHHSAHAYFRWGTKPWSACSATCGGGTRTRIQKCVRLKTQPDTYAYYANSKCSALVKPTDVTLEESCNEEDCPADWIVTEWSQVSVILYKVFSRG